MTKELFNTLWMLSGYEDEYGFPCIDVDGLTYSLENGKVYSNVQN